MIKRKEFCNQSNIKIKKNIKEFSFWIFYLLNEFGSIELLIISFKLITPITSRYLRHTQVNEKSLFISNNSFNAQFIFQILKFKCKLHVPHRGQRHALLQVLLTRFSFFPRSCQYASRTSTQTLDDETIVCSHVYKRHSSGIPQKKIGK